MDGMRVYQALNSIRLENVGQALIVDDPNASIRCLRTTKQGNCTEYLFHIDERFHASHSEIDGAKALPDAAPN
jgi:hypothetical protein